MDNACRATDSAELAGTDTRAPSAPVDLVRRIESWPYIGSERRGDCAILRSEGRGLVVGMLNLATGALTVNVPSDLAGAVHEHHPPLETTENRMLIDVIGPDSRRAAEALLRWRIDLERFGPQFRAASP